MSYLNVDALIEVLEASIKKNGEKTLTNRYLLNIVKFTLKKEYYDDEDRTEDMFSVF